MYLSVIFRKDEDLKVRLTFNHNEDPFLRGHPTKLPQMTMNSKFNNLQMDHWKSRSPQYPGSTSKIGATADP